MPDLRTCKRISTTNLSITKGLSNNDFTKKIKHILMPTIKPLRSLRKKQQVVSLIPLTS